MSSVIGWMDRHFYPGITDNWDDALFRDRILSALQPQHVVLDLGAGAGIVQQMDFRGYAARICGVDLDPRVVENPLLDEGRVADAGRIPYPDGTFDVAFADNVMEHVEAVDGVLTEVRRVLKPGGRSLFKTPNRRHYMPLIARLTPHWFHQFVNRLRGRAVVDTFPTRYRANTKEAIHRLADAAGFQVERLERVESRPEYLRMTVPTYIAGVLYERFVNRFDRLAAFRILIIAELRKAPV